MYLRAVKVETYERQSVETRYYECLKNYAETSEEAATVATLFQMVQKLNEEIIDLRAKL